MCRFFPLFVIVMLAGSVLPAQQPAPRDMVSVMVGGEEVTIEYGRPDLKGRKVSDLLTTLPEDRMWRAGSDQITTLTTQTDLSLAGKKVPAGKYALYVHCAKNGDVSLAVNSALGQRLGDIWSEAPEEQADLLWPHFNYQSEISAREVARAPMARVQTSKSDDLFTISFEPAGDGAKLTMSWGTERWSLDVKRAR